MAWCSKYHMLSAMSAMSQHIEIECHILECQIYHKIVNNRNTSMSYLYCLLIENVKGLKNRHKHPKCHNAKNIALSILSK